MSLRIGYCALKECFIPYRDLQPILALRETRFDALTSTKDLKKATKGDFWVYIPEEDKLKAITRINELENTSAGETPAPKEIPIQIPTQTLSEELNDFKAIRESYRL